MDDKKETTVVDVSELSVESVESLGDNALGEALKRFNSEKENGVKSGYAQHHSSTHTSHSSGSLW